MKGSPSKDFPKADTRHSGMCNAEIVKPVLTMQVMATLKWFSDQNGYGFINSNDTTEDVFVPMHLLP